MNVSIHVDRESGLFEELRLVSVDVNAHPSGLDHIISRKDEVPDAPMLSNGSDVWGQSVEVDGVDTRDLAATKLIERGNRRRPCLERVAGPALSASPTFT
jgi:hypothetical protein